MAIIVITTKSSTKVKAEDARRWTDWAFFPRFDDSRTTGWSDISLVPHKNLNAVKELYSNQPADRFLRQPMTKTWSRSRGRRIRQTTLPNCFAYATLCQ